MFAFNSVVDVFLHPRAVTIAFINNQFYETEVEEGLVDDDTFQIIPTDVDVIMITLDERKEEAKRRIAGMGVRDALIVQALHHTQDHMEIANMINATGIESGAAGVMASAMRALGTYLGKEERKKYLLLLEDDVVPLERNLTFSNLKVLENMPRGGNMSIYFLGETVRCGRSNYCRKKHKWLRVNHDLAGAHAVLFNLAAVEDLFQRFVVEKEWVRENWDHAISGPRYDVFRYDGYKSKDGMFCGLYGQEGVDCYHRKGSVANPM